MARNRVSENKVVGAPAGAAPARHKTSFPKRVTRPAVVELSDAPLSEPEVPSEAPAAVVTSLTATAAAAPAESFHDAVAKLAYSYWEARGCQGGCPEVDWLRAEQELLAR